MLSLDPTDRQILAILQTEARLSFSELGRRVGLSPPAATERVRKLEEAKIISGYHTDLNPDVLGLSLTAFLQLTVPPACYPEIRTLLHELPEVLEAHHITGDGSFLIKTLTRSTQHLEAVIGKFSQYGQTNTSIVLSTPVSTKAIALPPPDPATRAS